MKKLLCVGMLIMGLCSLSWAQRPIKFTKMGQRIQFTLKGRGGFKGFRRAASKELPPSPPAQHSPQADHPMPPVPTSLPGISKEATVKANLSPVAYFHRLGNEEFWEPPQETYSSRHRVGSEYSGRSLESLRLEASALGILPQDWAVYSREELAEFISVYKTFKASANVRSRFDEDGDDGKFARRPASLQLDEWARQQPDFVESNYVYKEYKEPFNPSVKKLRILLIQDDDDWANTLMRVADDMPAVTVEWVCGAKEALNLLNKHPRQYDIILTDYCMDNGNASELGMHIWNKRMNIPVVFYSLASAQPSWLLKYNIVGRIELAATDSEAEQVINYLSNMAATGKAYPDK